MSLLGNMLTFLEVEENWGLNDYELVINIYC